jgi:hypothetical protein
MAATNCWRASTEDNNRCSRATGEKRGQGARVNKLN